MPFPDNDPMARVRRVRYASAKRKRGQEDDDAVDLQQPKFRSLPSNRPGTPRADIRNVSFNVEPLPGADPMPPGHRSASPSRPAIRAVSAIGHPTRGPDVPALTWSEVQTCDQLHKLRKEVVDFAKGFRPVPSKSRSSSALDALLEKRAHLETVAFTSLLVLGGEGGRQSWEDFLTDATALQGIVIGIVFRALKEHIFDAVLFGATKTAQQKLVEFKQTTAEWHAFSRKYEESTVHASLSTKTPIAEVTQAKAKAYERLTTQIFKLIKPLYCLGSKQRPDEVVAKAIAPSLYQLVKLADEAATNLKMSSDTVWEWTNAFKDLEFDPKLAECFNVSEMLENSPYGKDAVSGRARLKPGMEDRRQSIIAAIVSPGLVGYRRGTGEQWQNEGHMTGAIHSKSLPVGFSRQVVMKNVVWLRWGKQRLRTRTLGRPLEFRKALDAGEEEIDSVALWDLFVERHAA